MFDILNHLARFRPKEMEQQGQISVLKYHDYSARDRHDDIMSDRHKEIIQEKANRFISVPAHMTRFVYKNLSQGLFKDFFSKFRGGE